METMNTSNKKKVFGYNPETDDWHCLKCGISLGRSNPRQLCGKTDCPNVPNDDEWDSVLLEESKKT